MDLDNKKGESEEQVNYNQIFQAITNQLQGQNVAKQAQLRLITTLTLIKDKVKQYKVLEHNDLISKRLSENQEAQNQIQQLIQKDKQKLPSNIQKCLNFDYILNEGDKFPNFNNLEKVFDEEKIHSLKQEEGQILVLYFWASWCVDSLVYLEKNQQSYNNNQSAWKSKVKYVTLTLDVDRGETIQRLTEIDNWENFDHYFLKSFEKNSEIVQAFQVEEIPKIVLIGSDGSIEYIGHPQKIRLTNYINQLLQLNEKQLQQKQQQVKEEKSSSNESQKQLNQKQDSNNTNQQKQKFQINENDHKTLEQYLKNDLIQLLNVKFNNYKGELLFMLQKEIIFDQGKVSYQYFPCQIKYSATKKQVIIASEILDEIYKKINKENFFLSEERIEDNKQTIINHVYNINLICQNNGINNLKLALLKDYYWIIRNSEFSFRTRCQLIQDEECVIEGMNAQKLTNVNEDLISYCQKCHNCDIDIDEIEELINQGIQIQKQGLIYQPLDNLHRINRKENVKLNINEGEILVIVFWAIWCTPCLTCLDDLNNQAQQNQQKWKNRVRIAAVNMDPEDQETSLVIFEQGWNQMEFYYFNGESKYNQTVQIFDVQKTIPYIIVVGLDKKIYFAGASENTMIHDVINFALENKKMNFSKNQITEVEEEKKNDEIGQLSLHKSQSSKDKNLQSNCKQLKSTLKQISQMQNLLGKDKSRNSLTLMIQKKIYFSFSGEVIYSYYEQPQLKYSVLQSNKDVFDQFLKTVFDKCPKASIKVEEQVLKTVDIPIGDKCSLCKTPLKKQEIQFWCKFTGEHLCEKCANEQIYSEQLEQEVFKYLHNLVEINPHFKEENLKGVDEFKFGFDIQPTSFDQVNQIHNVMCSICQEEIVGNRYICLNCVEDQAGFELCGICNEKIHNSAKQKEGQLEMDQFGHNKQHVLLRVLYNVGSMEY